MNKVINNHLNYLRCDYPLWAHFISFFFFFNDTATTEIYTLSLHDALPIAITELASGGRTISPSQFIVRRADNGDERSEEHTSELQSRRDLVCRLLLEK